MLWTSALAIFFLFWFLSLFLVLPFHGRRADAGDGDLLVGQERGAPVSIRPWRIIGQVTLVAALLFGGYYAIYTSGLVTRDSLDIFGTPPRG